MVAKARTPLCHPGNKHHSSGVCCKCYQRAWYLKNREQQLAACAVRRREKAAEIAAYKKNWAEKKREHVRANYRRWFAANRDRQLAKMREAHERDPEDTVRRNREWRKANPERFKEQGRICAIRRRARAAASPGLVPTAEQLADVRWLLGGRCYYCGECAADRVEVDHVVPIVDGGSVGIENLVPACRACNASKNDKGALEWLTTGRRANDNRFEPARRRLRAA